MINNKIKFVLQSVFVLVVVASALAVPPHPMVQQELATAKVKAEAPYYIANYERLQQRGVCSNINPYEQIYNDAKATVSKSLAINGPFNALAILVEFSDQPSNTPALYFDSLLFDADGNSVRDYYSKISYGQLDLVTLDLPSSNDWQMAPQAYSYYVNGENGTGDYPNNSQRLVQDLVGQVDGVIDFSKYDNDNNGFVDILIVIHSGPGAEVTYSDNDIWSHKWQIYPQATGDGVSVSSYTIQPEYIHQPGDMTIGIFAHELGHGFGLPDLYDPNYVSNGIGSWGVMSYGCWLGPDGNGGSPAHPCAWSRIKMGFADYTNVTSNLVSQSINDVKSDGSIYRLWSSGVLENEYFLLENRQKTGYDSYLPASGLYIWHIDDAKPDNSQYWMPEMDANNHAVVALVQADGLYDLESMTNHGDADDLFPGNTLNHTFNALSLPNSNSYLDGNSFVAVTNIVESGSNILADLTVGFSASNGDDEPLLPEMIELYQNYPNPFNPSTNIEFNLPEDGAITLEVFNIVGQRVATIIDEHRPAGTYSLEWEAEDDFGNPLGSGLYLYRLIVNEQTDTKKMTLLR